MSSLAASTTMMTNATDLVARLTKVGLSAIACVLDDFLARATKGRWSPAQILEEIVRLEEIDRTRRSLQSRLQRARIGRFKPMTDFDWAAWMGTKAVLQALLARKAAGAPALNTWTAGDFVMDGFKGVRVSFRPWDRQLRQPLLLTDGQGVIATAPVEGLLHPSNVLDTLGADAPEKLCKASP